MATSLFCQSLSCPKERAVEGCRASGSQQKEQQIFAGDKTRSTSTRGSVLFLWRRREEGNERAGQVFCFETETQGDYSLFMLLATSEEIGALSCVARTSL